MPYVYQYPAGAPTQGIPGQYAYVPGPQTPQGQLEQLRATQAPAYVQAPVQGPQNAGTGIQWVQGEAGAKAYLVAPGASVLLMDSEGQSFYIKSTDGSGMPLPLRIFDYVERQAQAVPPVVPQAPADAPAQPMGDYVTRGELDALLRRLDELEKQTPAPAKQEAQAPETRKGGSQNGKRDL